MRNFRAELVRELVDAACKFCEDVSVSSTSLIRYLDTSLRLEAMQLPPDTAVPKKRMTLKRLRKAQRLKAAIEAGEEDRSQERDWPALELGPLVAACKASEDPAAAATPRALAEPAEGGRCQGQGQGQGQGGRCGGTGGRGFNREPPAPLLPDEWVASMTERSVAHGSVTTAHQPHSRGMQWLPSSCLLCASIWVLCEKSIPRCCRRRRRG